MPMFVSGLIPPPSNLLALRNALNELGCEFDDFPEDVKNGQQNISTFFNPDRSFDECYE